MARAEAAFAAGCDMVLLCNESVQCDELLAGLVAAGHTASPELTQHLARMRARGGKPPTLLSDDANYLAARARVAAAAAMAPARD